MVRTSLILFYTTNHTMLIMLGPLRFVLLPFSSNCFMIFIYDIYSRTAKYTREHELGTGRVLAQ